MTSFSTKSDLEHIEIIKAVPWSNFSQSLRKHSKTYQKGEVPPQLKPYLLKKNSFPQQCAKETQNLKGKERVHAMNLCVAEKSKKQ